MQTKLVNERTYDRHFKYRMESHSFCINIWAEQEEKERVEREKREEEMREYQERVKKLEEVERKKRQRELEIEERERRREEERRNLEDPLSRKVNSISDKLTFLSRIQRCMSRSPVQTTGLHFSLYPLQTTTSLQNHLWRVPQSFEVYFEMWRPAGWGEDRKLKSCNREEKRVLFCFCTDSIGYNPPNSSVLK